MAGLRLPKAVEKEREYRHTSEHRNRIRTVAVRLSISGILISGAESNAACTLYKVELHPRKVRDPFVIAAISPLAKKRHAKHGAHTSPNRTLRQGAHNNPISTARQPSINSKPLYQFFGLSNRKININFYWPVVKS
jgi:hypothetical protein